MAPRYARPRSWDYERAYRLNLVVDVLLHDPAVSVAHLTTMLDGAGLRADVRTVFGLRDEARCLTGTPPEQREGWTFTDAMWHLGMGKRRLRWIVAELGMPEPSSGPVRRWPPTEWQRLLQRLEAERWRRPKVVELVRRSGGRRGPLPPASGRDPMGDWWDPDVVLRWREARTPGGQPGRA